MTFRKFQDTLFIIGIFLIIHSVIMLFPAFIDYYYQGNDVITFIVSSLITAFWGGVLVIGNRFSDFSISRRQTFLLTAIAWYCLTFFSTLPFILSPSLQVSITDAIFETASGISTTGATILTNLEDLPKSLHVWRAMLQWFGGVGIVVIAFGIMPMLKVGGMQLFQTESSDRSDKVVAKTKQISIRIILYYSILTILCGLLYRISGMESFDALIHALTTMATGGYSTKDSSFVAFSAGSQWVAIIFMFLAGTPLLLWIYFLKGRPKELFADQQVQFYSSVVLFISSMVCLFLVVNDIFVDFFVALRQSLFFVISTITTTGYVSADYAAWGYHFIVALALFLTYLGGCSGSTAGGFKMFRMQIAFSLAYKQLRLMIRPNAVFTTQYNGKLVEDDTISSILLFSVAWILTLCITTLALSFLGLDVVTSLTGASTALANVGPGLGEIIGPSGNFATLPDASKLVLSFAMILGRLEIMTVLVLLVPDFWRA